MVTHEKFYKWTKWIFQDIQIWQVDVRQNKTKKQSIKINTEILKQHIYKKKLEKTYKAKSLFRIYEDLLQLKKKKNQHNAKMSKDLNMFFTGRVMEIAPHT